MAWDLFIVITVINELNFKRTNVIIDRYNSATVHCYILIIIGLTVSDTLSKLLDFSICFISMGLPYEVASHKQDYSRGY